jgi:hypothetical protein
LTTALFLCAVSARADPSNGLPTEFRPSFPVFGGGPMVNFLNGDNQALTNASAHVAWSLAVPAIGQMLWGRKGLWISGLSWIALTVVQESLFHAPSQPGLDYPSEVRSDLITRIVPCATLLVVDALRGRRGGAARPDVPPEGWRVLPRISLDSPSMPPDGSRPAVKLGPLLTALQVAAAAGALESGHAFAARSQWESGPPGDARKRSATSDDAATRESSRERPDRGTSREPAAVEATVEIEQRSDAL